MSFNIDQKLHSLQDVELLLKKDSKIVLGEEAVARIRKCREYLDNRMMTQKEPIYGITTGFGSLCNVSVGADDLSALQKRSKKYTLTNRLTPSRKKVEEGRICTMYSFSAAVAGRNASTSRCILNICLLMLISIPPFLRRHK